MPRHVAVFVAAVVLIAGATAFAPPSAAQEGAVDKLYAELFELPPAERSKRIAEGAAKEGPALLRPSFRSGPGQAMMAAFAKDHPNLKVSWDLAVSQSVAEKFIVEARVGRYESDVTSGAISEISEVINRNLEAKYPSPAAEAILPKYRPFADPQNRWVLSHLNDIGISYNPTLIEPGQEPQSWEDLCAPRFQGVVSYEPAQTRMLAGLHQLYGGDYDKVEKLLKCIGDNKPIMVPGNTTRMLLMMAGDHAVSANLSLGGAIDMNRKNPKKAPFAINYKIPLMSYAEGFAISKNTARPYTTALYLDWVLGPVNQQLVYNNVRGPVTMDHPYHPPNVQLVPVGIVDSATLEKLYGLWNKNVGRR
jgi:ABC-type Fe3+ transport system substrate-binding protein